MRKAMLGRVGMLTACGLLAVASALAQSPPSASQDSATFDVDGTAHITRVESWTPPPAASSARPMPPKPVRIDI